MITIIIITVVIFINISIIIIILVIFSSGVNYEELENPNVVEVEVNDSEEHTEPTDKPNE